MWLEVIFDPTLNVLMLSHLIASKSVEYDLQAGWEKPESHKGVVPVAVCLFRVAYVFSPKSYWSDHRQIWFQFGFEAYCARCAKLYFIPFRDFDIVEGHRNEVSTIA